MIKKIFFVSLFYSSWVFFFFSSTSSLAGERLNKDYYFFFTKHLTYTVIAILIMLLISFVKTEIIIKLVFPLFLVSFFLLSMVPISGIEIKGSKRWIDLYFFRLQPIEILKPLFILTSVKILTIEKLKNTQIKIPFKFYTIVLCYNF